MSQKSNEQLFLDHKIMGTFMEDLTFGLDLKTWGRFQLAVLVRIVSQAEVMSAKLEDEQSPEGI